MSRPKACVTDAKWSPAAWLLPAWVAGVGIVLSASLVPALAAP
jgi:hypothetical protein